MKVKATEKRYYTIGEVAKRFNVKPSLIRFWESEFAILNPKKIIEVLENSPQKI